MSRLLSYVFILIFFCIYTHAYAQSPVIQWQECLGGSSTDEATVIRQVRDSGYIVAGMSSSYDGDVTGQHAPSDFWITRLSSTGALLWQKALGGSNAEVAEDINQTFDGGFIVTGYCNSTDGDVTGNHGTWDYWVVKLADSGAIQWQRSLGGSMTDLGYSIQQTSDSGYIVAGSSYSVDGDITTHHDSADSWVIKLSHSGATEWQVSLGGSSNDGASTIRQTFDGGYILASVSNSSDGDVTGNHGGNDAWITKLSDSGIIQWEHAYGGSGDELVTDLQQTSDSGYIIASSSNSTDGDVTGNHGDYDYWILKIDATGSIQWQKSFGGTQGDFLSSVQQSPDNGYIISGTTFSGDGDIAVNYGQSDLWMIKLSFEGELQWQKSLGGSDYDDAGAAQATTDSGYIVAGFTSSADSGITTYDGSTDFWIIKLGYQPQIDTTTGVSTLALPSSISIFPNPTNADITVTASKTITNIIISNPVGQTVCDQNANNSTVVVNVSGLPSGIYFVKVNGAAVSKFVKE